MKFGRFVGKRLKRFKQSGFLTLLSVLFFLLSAVLPLPVPADQEQSTPAKNKHANSVLQARVYAATCLACVRRIERHLRQSPGVRDVDVKIEANCLYTIAYDRKKTSEKNLLQLIEKEGYRVEKVQPGEK